MTNLVQLALTYTNLAVQLMVGDANFYAERLKLPEALPIQSSSLVAWEVNGKHVGINGMLLTSNCQYQFFQGRLEKITRTDLVAPKFGEGLDKKGGLSEGELVEVALNYLRVLSFDTQELVAKYSRSVERDTQYGLSYSDNDSTRRHVRKPLPVAKVKWGEYYSSFRDGRQFREIEVHVLQSTREIVGLRLVWSWTPELRPIFSKPPLVITNTPDLAVPEFFTGTATAGPTRTQFEPAEVSRLVRQARHQLLQALGTNVARCYLVSDNLNAPDIVQAELKSLLTNAPFAGISARWNEDLPFSRDKLDAIALGSRGIQIIAISGPPEVQLHVVPPSPEVRWEDTSALQEMRMTAESATNLQTAVTRFLGQIEFSAQPPDMLVFVGTGRLQSDFVWSLRKTAEKQTSLMMTGARGQLYLNGTNVDSSLAIHIKGPLPRGTSGVEKTLETVDKNFLTPLHQFPEFRVSPLEMLAEDVGVHTIETMRAANKVEAFRVTSDFDRSDKEVKLVNGYKLIHKAPEQGGHVGRALTALVVNEKNHFAAKLCTFNPGVIFRVWRGKEVVEVTICFSCNDLIIQAYDANGTETQRMETDFRPNRTELLKLCRQMFPDDQDLAALAEEK